VADQKAALSSAESGTLLRIKCQAPFEPETVVPMPSGFRVVGINSGVDRDGHGARFERARNAASIAHALILAKMREMGHSAGRQLMGDPMNGFLANLDPDDYKRFFRPYLPESLRGEDVELAIASMIEKETNNEAETVYHVQQAADHHVLESRRVRQFCDFVEQAAALPADEPSRFSLMDKAGHLMYASHLSYTNDALLGCDECDLLVDRVRAHEKSGLYGARITAGGCGGTVAVLCEIGERPEVALASIIDEYQAKTGRTAQLII
jgi:L-arabinokinase